MGGECMAQACEREAANPLFPLNPPCNAQRTLFLAALCRAPCSGLPVSARPCAGHSVPRSIDQSSVDVRGPITSSPGKGNAKDADRSYELLPL